ncbi:hypothetical protein [Cytobacillus sp. IB215316]|uniref:hypothetical protein n=1 Tax=Cytobacillus sp. IB215316 TaxID=3097354 RepID=UPI002A15E1D4|nr:hypothetical protein [Cytobacillus sp. IB215316]MDX8362533.1 hypothetical protein [Cytobacillus sp. IB215316]
MVENQSDKANNKIPKLDLAKFTFSPPGPMGWSITEYEQILDNIDQIVLNELAVKNHLSSLEGVILQEYPTVNTVTDDIVIQENSDEESAIKNEQLDGIGSEIPALEESVDTQEITTNGDTITDDHEEFDSHAKESGDFQVMEGSSHSHDDKGKNIRKGSKEALYRILLEEEFGEYPIFSASNQNSLKERKGESSSSGKLVEEKTQSIGKDTKSQIKDDENQSSKQQSKKGLHQLFDEENSKDGNVDKSPDLKTNVTHEKANDSTEPLSSLSSDEVDGIDKVDNVKEDSEKTKEITVNDTANVDQEILKEEKVIMIASTDPLPKPSIYISND